MKKLIFLAILSIVSVNKTMAQNHVKIGYIYDNAGNRTNCKVILYNDLKSTDSTPATLLSETELLDQFGIRVYPNPTHDMVFIEKTVDITSNAQIYLIRGDGKLVSIFSYTTNKIGIDFSHEAMGLYVLNFIIGNKKYQYKVIKN